jgi:L-aminopeptidase/D-esterase-like protein
MKAGLGAAAVDAGGGIIVAAIAAVNAFGDVLDPATGRILAGARRQPGPFDPAGPDPFADTLELLRQRHGSGQRFGPQPPPKSGEHTVIGVVATNARLNKEQANKVAQMAHDGLARTVRPAHTMVDGDTIFALALGPRRGEVSTIGAFAAEAFAQAVVRAVQTARPAGGLPALYAGR